MAMEKMVAQRLLAIASGWKRRKRGGAVPPCVPVLRSGVKPRTTPPPSQGGYV